MHRYGEETLLSDITEVLDLGLQAPVPFVLCQQLVLVEKPNPPILVRNRSLADVKK